MSANVPTSSIIEPPQFFLSMEHRVFEPVRLVMAGQSLSWKIRLSDCLREPIEERSVLIFLSFSDQFTASFFVRKLNNGKENKPIVAGAPTQKLERDYRIDNSSTNSASYDKYSLKINACDLILTLRRRKG